MSTLIKNRFALLPRTNPQPTFWPTFGPTFGIATRLLAALTLHRQRQHLLALDAHLLRDIGLTAAQAHAEAALPWWNAPVHWTSPKP